MATCVDWTTVIRYHKTTRINALIFIINIIIITIILNVKNDIVLKGNVV
jgi:hypothetical protein